MPLFLRSLRFRLIALVLFAALPAFGLMIYNAIEQYDHERVEAQENALRIVRQIAGEHDQIIALTRQLLMTLAHYPPVLNRDPLLCSAICSDLLKNQTVYLNLGAHDQDGKTYCSGLPLSAPVSAADLPYFQRVIETGEFSGSNFRIGRVHGKPTVHFGYPAVDQDGKVQAVTFAALDLSWLSVLASKIHLPEGSTLTIVDEKGTILVRYPDQEKWVGQKLRNGLVIATASAHEEGVARGVGMDGIERLYAVKRLAGEQSSGFVYVGLPAEQVFGAANRTLRQNVIALGLATILALLGAWGLSYFFIMKPVNVLTNTSTKLAAGDLTARAGLTQREGEVGELGMAFDRMGEALQRRDILHKRVLAEIESLQRRHKLILNSTWEGIFELDPSGNHTFVNPSAARMLGYEVEELLGQHSHSIWHHSKPDGSPYPEEDCPIYATLREGKVDHVRDEVFWRKDGSSFLAECMTAPIAVDGAIVGCVVSFFDVTEPRKARQELLDTRERLDLALKGANLGTFDWYVQSGAAVANERAAEIVGYSLDEIEQSFSFWEKLLHPEDRARALEKLQAHLEGRSDFYEDAYRLKAKSGEWKWILSRGKVVARSEEGLPLRMSGTYMDVTARKTTEDELHEITARLKALLDASPDMIYFKDLNGRNRIVNRALTELVGMTEKDMLGKNDEQLLPANLAEQCRKSDQEILQTLGPLRTEESMVTGNGQKIFFDSIKFPVLDEQCNPIGLGGVSRDITTRKQAEHTLRVSEERFRKVFEQGPLGMAVVGLDYKFNAVNATLCEMVGYTEDELTALTFVDITHPDDIEANVGYAEKLSRGEVPSYKMEKRYIKKNGGVLWINLTGSIVRDDDGKALYYLSMIEDITERMRSKVALMESEQALRTLVDGNPESVFLMDTDGTVLVCNETTARRLNKSMSELVGSCIYNFLPADLAEERKNLAHEVIHTGKPTRFEDVRFGRTIDICIEPIFDEQGNVAKLAVLGIDITNLRRAEEVQRRLATAIEQSAESIVITDTHGMIQYVNPVTEQITGFKRSEIVGKTPSIFKSGAHDRAFYEQLWNTIKAGDVWSGRIINKKKDGTLYHEDATISPVRDAYGKIVNFVAVKRDVTEHLELSRELLQAQKMEAIATLAGGVAHDFNNLLTVVLGYSELLLTDTDQQDPVHADLEKINKAALDGADLVRRLLAFSRKSEINPCRLNLNHQIQQLEKMLTRTIPKMIEVELNLADGLPPVSGDPIQMDQILMNLAVNAKDAMPDGGKLTFETANVLLDEEYVRAHIGAKPGEYVLLSVMDSGHGMDKETLDHIFQPFYTTKEVGKGTGLGLAMVYGIVKQHGGYITCYSEPGQGTTFKIYLPALLAESDQPETATHETLPRGGTETILLVDDEEFVRDLGKRILERSGYTVLTAANGKKALDLYKREKGKISLVILDLIMPGIGGKQCLEELLKINPKARVLIASGLAANGRTKEAIETGARGFLRKPYNMKGMLQSVREVLDQS